MYRATRNNLCKANVLQRFVGKVLFSFSVMIMTFMLSGCVNWAHMVESNELKTMATQGPQKCLSPNSSSVVLRLTTLQVAYSTLHRSTADHVGDTETKGYNFISGMNLKSDTLYVMSSIFIFIEVAAIKASLICKL